MVGAENVIECQLIVGIGEDRIEEGEISTMTQLRELFDRSDLTLFHVVLSNPYRPYSSHFTTGPRPPFLLFQGTPPSIHCPTGDNFTPFNAFPLIFILGSCLIHIPF